MRRGALGRVLRAAGRPLPGGRPPVRIIACGNCKILFQRKSRRFLIRCARQRDNEIELKNDLIFQRRRNPLCGKGLRSIRPAATSATVSGPTALSINSE